MRLRVDPWDPEYGASPELESELGPPAGLDLEVEESAPGGRSRPTPRTVAVLRVHRRRAADRGAAVRRGGRRAAPGLAGSWAVGCAWSTRPPKIAAVSVGRDAGGRRGLGRRRLRSRVGGQPLLFWPHVGSRSCARSILCRACRTRCARPRRTGARDARAAAAPISSSPTARSTTFCQGPAVGHG